MDVTVDRQAGRPRLWVPRKGHSEPLAVYSYRGSARAEGEVIDNVVALRQLLQS